MKKILFIVLLFCSATLWGQEFEYREASSRFTDVAAVNPPFSTTGLKIIRGCQIPTDYFQELLGSVHKDILSQKELDYLQEHPLAWGVKLTLSMGTVKGVTFTINKELLEMSSEETVRKLYNAYLGMAVDESRLNMSAPFNEKNYASVSFRIK
ncbi:MAG: hypothetical protein Q4D56_02160 [Bacteroides sp.]|nr:hypothetical protein [Bacteroides sp.]